MLDELLSIALLGTRGKAVRLPAFPEDLADVLPTESASPESQLLDAAAAAGLYSRAGAKTRAAVAPPNPSQPDRRHECSAKAADILAQLFEEPRRALMEEWLMLAGARGVRPPHRLLPRLLDAAAATRALQPIVREIIDNRGRWLMQFNPRWQFARPSDQSADESWQIGNHQQRAEALQTVRQSDASKAREMVSAAWKQDSADERVDWLGAFSVGLSDADGEFLESCLDDRSGRVREAAAALLASLPRSKFSERMRGRLASLVHFIPATVGSMFKLKRGTNARLDVSLPSSFDQSMGRDGISEKPKASIGPKQWWAQQIIGYIPLSHWTQSFSATAAEIVAAVPADFADMFIQGWLTALARQPEANWIEPLIDAAGTKIQLEPNVLLAIDPEIRAAVFMKLPKVFVHNISELRHLIDAWQPLDETVSRLIMNELDLPTVLAVDAQFSFHSGVLGELEDRIVRWSDAPADRRRLDSVLSVITLRREMHKEFP